MIVSSSVCFAPNAIGRKWFDICDDNRFFGGLIGVNNGSTTTQVNHYRKRTLQAKYLNVFY